MACFDAPSHGQNSGRTTHLLEFSGCLAAIQQQIGAIHTIISHSFGSMATLMGARHGVQTQQMIFIAPGLDANEFFRSFCTTLAFNRNLIDSLQQQLGQDMNEIADVDDSWQFFKPNQLLKHSSHRNLMIYDQDDEEIDYKQLTKASNEWVNLEPFMTMELGHYRILKDSTVINKINEWMLR